MHEPADAREPLELAPESAPAPDQIRQLAPDSKRGTAGGAAADEGRGAADGAQAGANEAAEPRKSAFVARFLDLPRWEQYIAASALVCLLGWLGTSAWTSFFALGRPGGWFFTFAVIGSLACVTLTLARSGPARWLGLSESSRRRTIVTFALLPAIGGAIELLQHFWAAVAFVAAVAMAFAAFRLLTDRNEEPDK